MGLKILHSADWHMDSPFASVPEPQRQQLRAAQKRIPLRLAELCRREQCDLVLLSGDLFDGQASADTVALLKKAFLACGVPVFIAPGNHDPATPVSVWEREQWPQNVCIFTDDLEYAEPEGLDCRVYGAGFQSMDCPSLLEDFQAEPGPRYNVAVLHGDPLRTDSPCNPVTAAQVRRSGLDYIALGHIHKAGFFRTGDTLCGWPGCPMGRGWDETGEKCFYLVTLEDTAVIRQLDSGLPCFFDVTADWEQADTVLPPTATRDYYRLTLTGPGPAPLEELRRQYAYLSWLVLRDRTTEPREPWADAGEDSLRGAFYRILQEQEDTETALLAAQIAQSLMQGREVRLP